MKDKRRVKKLSLITKKNSEIKIISIKSNDISMLSQASSFESKKKNRTIISSNVISEQKKGFLTKK